MRIVTKKQWQDYKIQKELLSKENHRLNQLVNQLLNGENICGEYCEHCEYGLKSEEFSPVMQYKVPHYICIKNITCKNFKQKITKRLLSS